jgi:hypothetical protein
MDQRLTLQDYGNILAQWAEIDSRREQEEAAKAEAFFSGQQWGGIMPWGIGNKIGGAPEYQKLIEQAKQQVKPGGLFGCGLTRFDPSTKTRVPVTQEWVDEAVAEVVRLNIELDAKSDQRADRLASLPWQSDEAEVDRIWEAVRAASAV